MTMTMTKLCVFHNCEEEKEEKEREKRKYEEKGGSDTIEISCEVYIISEFKRANVAIFQFHS